MQDEEDTVSNQMETQMLHKGKQGCAAYPGQYPEQGVLRRAAEPEMAHRCLGVQIFSQRRDKENLPQRYIGSL